jgi:hypothetical protein
MNHIRLSVFVGLIALVGLGFTARSAQAQYVPQPSGYPTGSYYAPSGGYYYTPQPARTYYAPRFYAPAPAYRSSAGSRRSVPYDPTGRHDGLARPWLRPLR